MNLSSLQDTMRRFLFPVLVGLSLLSTATFGLVPANGNDHMLSKALSSRRDALAATVVGLGFGLSSAFIGLSSSPANAFDNKISNKYDDRPKRRGPQVFSLLRHAALVSSRKLFLRHRSPLLYSPKISEFRHARASKETSILV